MKSGTLQKIKHILSCADKINGDCKVDILDLEIMLLHWLEENNP